MLTKLTVCLVHQDPSAIVLTPLLPNQCVLQEQLATRLRFLWEPTRRFLAQLELSLALAPVTPTLPPIALNAPLECGVLEELVEVLQSVLRDTSALLEPSQLLSTLALPATLTEPPVKELLTVTLLIALSVLTVVGACGERLLLSPALPASNALKLLLEMLRLSLLLALQVKCAQLLVLHLSLERPALTTTSAPLALPSPRNVLLARSEPLLLLPTPGTAPILLSAKSLQDGEKTIVSLLS